MGIARSCISLLLEERQRRQYSGAVMTLGRQTVQLGGYSELEELFARYGTKPAKDVRDVKLDDHSLFTALGFDTIHSLDYSDFEGATHQLDLNTGETPGHLLGQYDLVFDSGTIEHVFKIENAMRHAVLLARPGGRLIFMTPSSNHFEHGFYMVSPMFFYEYFRANRLNIETMYVLRSARGRRGTEAYEYKPGLWADVQIGGLDGSAYAIFVVATKTAESTTDVVPQQKIYLEQWSGELTSETIPAFSSPLREWVKSSFARTPRLYSAARTAERALRRARALTTGVADGLQNKRLIGRY